MLVSLPSHTFLISKVSSQVMLSFWSVYLVILSDISGIILGHVIMLVSLPSHTFLISQVSSQVMLSFWSVYLVILIGHLRYHPRSCYHVGQFT